jgi:hypothetical protein
MPLDISFNYDLTEGKMADLLADSSNILNRQKK